MAERLPLPAESPGARAVAADILFYVETLGLNIPEATQFYLDHRQIEVELEKARSEKGLTSVLGRIRPPLVPQKPTFDPFNGQPPVKQNEGFAPATALTPTPFQAENMLEVLGKGG